MLLAPSFTLETVDIFFLRRSNFLLQRTGAYRVSRLPLVGKLAGLPVKGRSARRARVDENPEPLPSLWAASHV